MQHTRESRGVKVARHTIDGYQVLYAVKRNGDRLPKVVVLRPGVDRGKAVEWLKGQLEIQDPGPRLVVEPTRAVLPPPESNIGYAMRIARKVQRSGVIRPLG